MDSPPGTVACAYCGGRHDGVDEVRSCWRRRSSGAPLAAATVAPALPGEPGASPAVAPSPGASPAVAPSRAPLDGNPAGLALAVQVLGRSVVVRPGEAPPEPWAGCPRASGELGQLEHAWRERAPLVIEVDQGDDWAADVEVERAPVWSLEPSFSFPGERRRHATWANAVDARGPSLVWSLSQTAVRLGARPGGPADVLLPDGRPAYCDGGPLTWRPDLGGHLVIPGETVLAGSLAPLGHHGPAVSLAPDQLAAVAHPGGAARVIAPAGSGKTRVLTERARHLLTQWGIPAAGITLVAFNKRAAEQMAERTPDLPQLQVRTLNSLGLSILSGHQPVTTIEEREARALLDRLVDLPRRSNADPAAAWLEALSAVRLGLVSPAQVEADYGGDVEGLPEVFDRYRAILADRRQVDFDEQIYRALEVLLTDPAARQGARRSCRLLLVDEFQDLTPAHLLLLRLLAGPPAAVFGVGDDDQTIYGYSGASPQWLIDYQRYFPTAVNHPLEVNYRCPPAVVDAARCLLSHNRRRVAKKIEAAWPRTSDGAELTVREAEDTLAETVAVVGKVLRAGAAPAQVAVLTRVNATLAPVQVALVHSGTPVRPAVDASYLLRGGVQAALAWLRLAVASAEHLASADLALAARRPSRGFSPKLVEWVSEQRSPRRLGQLAQRLNDRDGTKVSGFLDDLMRVRQVATKGPTAAVVRAVRDDLGLDQAMQLLETSRRRLDRSAQTDDLDALVALAGLHPEPDGFEEWLQRSLSVKGSPDGVVLSTIHRVKGREWPHVVLHDVTDGLLPHRLAEDVEEERRVFHVGLTRCSSTVHVVAGLPPSPFILELAQEWSPSKPERAPSPVSRGRGGSAPGRPVQLPRAAATRDGANRPSARAQVGPAPVRLVPPPTEPEIVERVRQKLRAWRTERARAEHKAPFIFLHDKTLEALAAAAPTTTADLAGVSGIGPAKIEAYGPEWLALIEAARQPLAT